MSAIAAGGDTGDGDIGGDGYSVDSGDGGSGGVSVHGDVMMVMVAMVVIQ